MTGCATSLRNNRPARYRARASEARQRAAAETDAEKRQRLLADAELWDRMANYEETYAYV
jgi:hypothetical protein